VGVNYDAPDEGEPNAMPPDKGKPTTMPLDKCKPTMTPPDKGEPTTMPPDKSEPTTMPPDNGEPTTMPHDEGEPTTMPLDKDEPTMMPPDKDDDQVDGFVSGGSVPGGWETQDNAPGQGIADMPIVGDDNGLGFSHPTKPGGTPEALPKFYWAVILQ
jgi:hypothetical protein